MKRHSEIFNEPIRLNYSRTEQVNTIDEIENNIARECLKYLKIEPPIFISTVADMPASTGLGGSSAFAVGLLNALHAYRGERVTAGQLAEEACYIEMEVLREPIGKQDQYAAAFGGLNLLRFARGGRVMVEPQRVVNGSVAHLFNNIMMFWTGHQRPAASVLTEQKATRPRTSTCCVACATTPTRCVRSALAGNRARADGQSASHQLGVEASSPPPKSRPPTSTAITRERSRRGGGRQAVRRGGRRLPHVHCQAGEPRQGAAVAVGTGLRAARLECARIAGALSLLKKQAVRGTTMIINETEIPGAYIVELEKREDDRGFFARGWCSREFAERGLPTRIAQMNISFNRSKHTLRGFPISARRIARTSSCAAFAARFTTC